MEEKISINLNLERVWPQYNLGVYRADFPLPLRLVVRNGRPVATVKSFYHVIPLEEVEETVTSLAEALELKKVYKFDTGTKLYAFYRSQYEEEFSDGSKFSVGIYAKNSIDGTTKLQFSLFTYRNVCGNVAMIVVQKLLSGVPMQEVVELVKSRSGEIGVLGSLSTVHTKKGEKIWESMKEKISALLPLGKRILEMYRRWEEREFIIDVAQELLDVGIPQKILTPVARIKENVTVESVKTTTNLLDAYNRIVQQTWYGVKSITRREQIFSKLHSVLMKEVIV